LANVLQMNSNASNKRYSDDIFLSYQLMPGAEQPLTGLSVELLPLGKGNYRIQPIMDPDVPSRYVTNRTHVGRICERCDLNPNRPEEKGRKKEISPFGTCTGFDGRQGVIHIDTNMNRLNQGTPCDVRFPGDPTLESLRTQGIQRNDPLPPAQNLIENL